MPSGHRARGAGGVNTDQRTADRDETEAGFHNHTSKPHAAGRGPESIGRGGIVGAELA